jgi:hypothetical protein
MSNDVLEAVESSGLLGDLSSIVVGYIREPPRPYIYRPLPWARVELDDRSDTFGSYITDLLTLPGT